MDCPTQEQTKDEQWMEVVEYAVDMGQIRRLGRGELMFLYTQFYQLHRPWGFFIGFGIGVLMVMVVLVVM